MYVVFQIYFFSAYIDTHMYDQVRCLKRSRDFFRGWGAQGVPHPRISKVYIQRMVLKYWNMSDFPRPKEPAICINP